MTHPTWFEWLTVLAIVVGPVLAILTQRYLDHGRERKNMRLSIYKTLMATRASPLHPDHVRALNSIDAVFDGDDEKDRMVRDMWGKVLAHLLTDANAPGWQEKAIDVRVDLYQAVAKAVGYDHSIDYIKNRIYTPKLYGDIEVEELLIRKSLAHAAKPEGFRVILVEPKAQAAEAAGGDGEPRA